MRWQLLYWNQEKVREALQRSAYDDASLRGGVAWSTSWPWPRAWACYTS